MSTACFGFAAIDAYWAVHLGVSVGAAMHAIC
jgi:hypothetical protein